MVRTSTFLPYQAFRRLALQSRPCLGVVPVGSGEPTYLCRAFSRHALPSRLCPTAARRWAIALVIVVGFSHIESAIAQSERPATEASASATEHPLDPALKIAFESLEYSQTQVRDYTALLSKRCRVGGELGDYQHAHVKIRNRRVDGDRVVVPMSVYMKFLKPDSVQGREIIWVEGRNKGQLVAHDAGLKNLFRVNLDPNGLLAMRGQRYPITEIGMEKLVQQMIEKGQRDRQYAECKVDFFREAKVDSRSCRMVQILHPEKRPHFDFYRAQVFFDDELKLPVRYASWSWPADPNGQPPLDEEYNYTKVKINVGLTERDFDPDNSEYNF